MLRTRVISAAVLLVIVSIPAILGGWPLLALVILMAGLASWEYVRLLRLGGHQPSMALTILFSALFVAQAQWPDLTSRWTCCWPAVVVGFLLLALWHKSPQPITDWALSLAGVLYLGWLLSYLVRLRLQPLGLSWLIMAALMVWTADGIISKSRGRDFRSLRRFVQNGLTVHKTSEVFPSLLRWYLGATATILLFFITPGLHWLGGLLFLIANVSFGASIVFYNSYLPNIASEDQRDRVSAFGWAMGYLGGGLLLLVNLVLFLFAEPLGLEESMVARISLASAGFWWLGFSTITFATLRQRQSARPLPRVTTT
jgi:hypothetical protein